MDSRSSTVAHRLRLKPTSVKSLEVTRIWAACRSIMFIILSYSAISPFWPARQRDSVLMLKSCGWWPQKRLSSENQYTTLATEGFRDGESRPAAAAAREETVAVPWICMSKGLLLSTCCCSSFCRPTLTPPLVTRITCLHGFLILWA